MLAGMGGVVGNGSMRQLLEKLAGPMPHYVPDPMARIQAGAPRKSNVYSDGGLRHAPHGPAALGNWGIFTAAALTSADVAPHSGGS